MNFFNENDFFNKMADTLVDIINRVEELELIISENNKILLAKKSKQKLASRAHYFIICNYCHYLWI